MGRIGNVVRVEDDAEGGQDVVVNLGGHNVTADFFQAPGEDAPPLAGDKCCVVDAPGRGRWMVAASSDALPATAEPGEVRRYARNSAGTAVCEFHLKGDGSVEIQSLVGNDITINGVTIDAAGNISAPGEVTARSATTRIALSTHTHLTAVAPTAPPTPGA